MPNCRSSKRFGLSDIESQLAACVNILPEMSSLYRWENKIEAATEILLIIKTTALAYLKLEELIVKIHPYNCPEIIGLPIESGAKNYLQWIQENVLEIGQKTI